MELYSKESIIQSPFGVKSSFGHPAPSRLIFHVKEHARIDLPAHAVLITDPTERRRIMAEVLRRNNWFASQPYSLEDWVADSPLVAVEFDSNVGEADTS